MLDLVTKMLRRAKGDCLLPSHELRVAARELHDATVLRFEVYPAQVTPGQWVETYRRAYIVWHLYSGED